MKLQNILECKPGVAIIIDLDISKPQRHEMTWNCFILMERSGSGNTVVLAQNVHVACGSGDG